MMMKTITVYTTALCPYCRAAKRLLQKKGVDYEEIDVTLDPGAREKMRALAGGADTVPQIFIGDFHVGGCEELLELDGDDELDPMLGL